MLIADLSGQGFLELCGSDQALRILSCHLLSKSAVMTFLPHTNTDSLLHPLPLRNSRDRKGDTIGNVKKWIMLPFEIHHSLYILPAGLFMCTINTVHSLITRLSAAVQVRAKL